MAIDASSLTEKDELIAKFYTIRAGLSVIAEESEKIRKIEKEIQELKLEDESYREKAKYDANREKNILEYEKLKTENKIKEAQSSLTNIKNERERIYNNGGKKYRPSLPIGLMVALSIIGIVITLIVASIFEHSLSPDAVPFFVCFIYLYIFFIIVFFIIQRYRIGQKLWWDDIYKQDEIIKKRELSLLELKKDLEKKQEEINELQNNILPAIHNASPNSSQISLLKSKHYRTVSVSTQKAKSIRNALIKEFGDILTEDDWGNVDLLIFYLNTGRADSLKEALQLVDRQRQTNQIVQAIGTAASYISNTMQANTYKLARVMDNCFSNLSNQISTNHQQLIGAMNNISDSFNSRIGSFESTVKTQSQALLDSQALNASLLKEANRRSDELMNELRYNQKYWVK